MRIREVHGFLIRTMARALKRFMTATIPLSRRNNKENWGRKRQTSGCFSNTCRLNTPREKPLEDACPAKPSISSCTVQVESPASQPSRHHDSCCLASAAFSWVRSCSMICLLQLQRTTPSQSCPQTKHASPRTFCSDRSDLLRASDGGTLGRRSASTPGL